MRNMHRFRFIPRKRHVSSWYLLSIHSGPLVSAYTRRLCMERPIYGPSIMTVVSLFVPRLSFLQCSGKAIVCVCGISWVSSILVLFKLRRCSNQVGWIILGKDYTIMYTRQPVNPCVLSCTHPFLFKKRKEFSDGSEPFW